MYFNRGEAYREKGDLDNAIKDLGESIDLDGKNAARISAAPRRCAPRASSTRHRRLRSGDQARSRNRVLQHPQPRLLREARLRARHRRPDAGDQAQSEEHADDLQSRHGLSRQGRAGARGAGLRSGLKNTPTDAFASTTAGSPIATCATTTAPSATSIRRSRSIHLTAAINDRGLAYVSKGETDHAIADFDQAIQINPKDSLAYNNRGLAYRNKGETDTAINNYDQAILISPDFALAYYNRGNAYYDKRDYDRAIPDYNQALKINPNYALAYLRSRRRLLRPPRLREGGRRSEQGDRARAQGFAGLLQPRPDLSRHGRDGQGARRFRPVDQARSEESRCRTTTAAWRSATRATMSAPSPISASRSASTRATRWRSTIAVWPMGSARFRPSALADYEQAIRINPGYAPTYYNRGLAYFERRDYDRAIQDLNQAINGRPNYPLAFNIRGLAYIAKGEIDRAIEDFDQAIRLDAKFAARLQQSRRGLSGQARSRPRHRRLRSGDQGQSELRRGLLQPRHGVSRQARLRERDRGFRRRRSRSIRRTRRRTTTAASPIGTRATTTTPSPTSSRRSSSIRSSRRPMPIAAPPITTSATTTTPSPTSISRSSSIRTARRPITTAVSPIATRATSTRAITDFDQAIKLDPKFAAAYRQPRPRLQQQAGLQPRHRRSRQRDPARRQVRRRLQRSRPGQRRDRQDRSRHRRFHPGDPAQSELRHRLQQPRPDLSRQGRRRRAPSTTSTRPSRSIPRYDVAYNNRGLTYQGQGRCRAAPSPTSARPSPSIRTSTSPTTTAARPIAPRAISTRRSRISTRRSRSIRTTRRAST